jgi:predicted aldo/keto reductase-like oxidoreductase
MIRLIETGEFASITLQYNLLDRANASVIARAHELGVGVVVMGPVGGGRLAMSPEVLRQYGATDRSITNTPEIAMRFVLTNPGVTVALSGMNAFSQIEENVVTANRAESLSVAELWQVDDALGEIQKLADLYCTGCGYCQPCPNGVKIAENFKLMNYARLYGLTDYARQSYAGLVNRWGGAAEKCIECGECEPKCPQNIRIPEQLREVVAALA